MVNVHAHPSHHHDEGGRRVLTESFVVCPPHSAEVAVPIYDERENSEEQCKERFEMRTGLANHGGTALMVSVQECVNSRESTHWDRREAREAGAGAASAGAVGLSLLRATDALKLNQRWT
ncbi:MAG: hypothetical protein HW407_843 [Bacteroidetes bacterium]|nr:hypothetical protein [Bacteroidota bacterium]